MRSRPSPGSDPGPAQVPSWVRRGPAQIHHVLCFTAFRTHAGPEVGAIPARPGVPSSSRAFLLDRAWRAETDFLATSDWNLNFWQPRCLDCLPQARGFRTGEKYCTSNIYTAKTREGRLYLLCRTLVCTKPWFKRFLSYSHLVKACVCHSKDEESAQRFLAQSLSWEKLNRGVSKPRYLPLFSGKVQIVSRALSGLFLVGALNRLRKRKRTNRENPRTIPDWNPPV